MSGSGTLVCFTALVATAFMACAIATGVEMPRAFAISTAQNTEPFFFVAPVGGALPSSSPGCPTRQQGAHKHSGPLEGCSDVPQAERTPWTRHVDDDAAPYDPDAPNGTPGSHRADPHVEPLPRRRRVPAPEPSVDIPKALKGPPGSASQLTLWAAPRAAAAAGLTKLPPESQRPQGCNDDPVPILVRWRQTEDLLFACTESTQTYPRATAKCSKPESGLTFFLRHSPRARF